MRQSLCAESPDRLGLLSADDDELWQLTVVHTVTTDMMGLLVLTFVGERAEFVYDNTQLSRHIFSRQKGATSRKFCAARHNTQVFGGSFIV